MSDPTISELIEQLPERQRHEFALWCVERAVERETALRGPERSLTHAITVKRAWLNGGVAARHLNEANYRCWKFSYGKGDDFDGAREELGRAAAYMLNTESGGRMCATQASHHALIYHAELGCSPIEGEDRYGEELAAETERQLTWLREKVGVSVPSSD